MEVGNPNSVLEEFSSIRDEFPERHVMPRSLLSGAGQIRACGHLAILANASEVYSRIEDAYYGITSARAMDEVMEREAFSPSLDRNATVQIVCSLGGGTGSGAFLDVALMCRHIAASNDRILGFLILPDVFAGFPGCDFVRGNSYAALMELDHLMGRAGKSDSDLIRYGHGIDIDWARTAPFDHVYLIGNSNEQGVRYSGLSDISGFIGGVLFANSGATAEQREDILDNIAGYRAPTSSWKGKLSHYAGVGASSIRIPIEAIIRRSSLRKAGLLITQGFLAPCDGQAALEDVSNFMLQTRIRESGADDVIDSILDPMNIQRPARLEPHPRSPDLVKQIRGWETSETQRIENCYNKAAERNLEAKIREAKTEIEQKVLDDICKEEAGVTYAQSFLRSLLTRLRMCEMEMRHERTALEEERAIDWTDRPSDTELKNASMRLFPRARIQQIFLRLESSMMTESEKMLQIIRREYATSFFTDIGNAVEDILNQLGSLSERLLGAGEIIAEMSRLSLRSRPDDSFTKSLDESVLDEDIAKVDKGFTLPSFIDVLQREGESPLAWGAADWNSQRIVDRLYEIASARYAVLAERSIDSVLSEARTKDPSAFRAYIRDFLVERATPLWRPSPAASRRDVTEVLVIGVEDAESSILQQVDPSELGISARSWALTSTGDPHSVTAYRYKLSLPAYLIEGMADLGRDYEKHEARAAFTHHSRRRWADNPEQLGDLFPDRGKGPEEQMMYWAVSFAKPFELISRKGSHHYYIRSRRYGQPIEDYMIKLGQGRLAAFEAFAGEGTGLEIFAEAKETITALVAAHGTVKVLESLQEYGRELIGHIETQSMSSEVRILLEREMEAINRFAQTLDPI